MTISEGMKTYGLQGETTTEQLAMRFSGIDGKVLNFGDKVLLAGYRFNGLHKPTYFAATYEFLTDDRTCEGAIQLKAVSEIAFEDDGHAIAWAMRH